MACWVALAIGNSRLHWATFEGDKLQTVQHTPYLDQGAIARLLNHPEQVEPWCKLVGLSMPPRELWVASVVPEQTQLWQHPFVRMLQSSQVPLLGLYPTLGVDRSLALWGAGALYGYPVLVVDAGTALTLTAADARPHFGGGAILPGLGLQLRALAERTAALPALALPEQLPPRWATTTSEAICSGVIYTAIAGLQSFMQDWWQQFPQGQVVLTGGDAERLYAYLQAISPDLERVRLDLTVLFHGITALRRELSPPG